MVRWRSSRMYRSAESVTPSRTTFSRVSSSTSSRIVAFSDELGLNYCLALEQRYVQLDPGNEEIGDGVVLQIDSGACRYVIHENYSLAELPCATWIMFRAG